MERYIGLDVHAQSCTLAVVSAAGKRLGLQVVETNGTAVKQAISVIAGNRHICLEEGTQICVDMEYVSNGPKGPANRGSSPNQMQPACAMNLSRSREERMG